MVDTHRSRVLLTNNEINRSSDHVPTQSFDFSEVRFGRRQPLREGGKGHEDGGTGSTSGDEDNRVRGLFLMVGGFWFWSLVWVSRGPTEFLSVRGRVSE